MEPKNEEKLKPYSSSLILRYKADPSVEEYDPHIHRVVPHATTNFETLVHMLKGSLGTGILAMPEAFKNAGLWNGTILTVLIGFLLTYCLHVLLHAQYILCQRIQYPVLTYPQSMKLALRIGPKPLKIFARYSDLVVDFFLVVHQYGICMVYVVFVAVNLKAVLDEYTTHNISIQLFTITLFVPFLLILCIRNLKILAPFSTVANILTVVLFGVVCYYVFQQLPNLFEVEAIANVQNYPLFFGTTVFALETVGVIITLEMNMKTPKSFTGYFGVLNISMGIIVFTYIIFGFLGYWKYGKDIKPSITLNFPSDEWLTKAARILYSVAIYISYGLQGYVPIQILWDTYIVTRIKSRPLLWEYVLRFSSVVFTFVFAICIPLLGLFISLIGAFCLSTLGIAFPAIMDICVKHPNGYGRIKIHLIKDILLIIFGIIGLILGSALSIHEIVTALMGSDNSTETQTEEN